MAQATILASGTTLATSSDVVVAAGASVSIGLFTADAAGIPGNHSAVIMMDTPSVDVVVDELSGVRPVRVVAGPGTFRVIRRAGTTSFGVFTET